MLQMPLVSDPSTLALGLDGAITTMTDGNGVQIASVPFHFTSVPWHGTTWTHHATLYLPLPAPAGGWTTAAVDSEQTTEGTDVPNPLVAGLYASAVASATGVPVAIISNVPPNPLTLPGDGADVTALLAAHPELSMCFGAPLDETTLQTCTDAIYQDGADTTWNLEPALARAYLRSLVALRNLEPLIQADPTGSALAAFQPTSFATGGYSKRGMAQWFVAAADPSVTAIWVGSGEQPSFKMYTQLKFSEWGDQSSLIQPLSFWDTPFGQEAIAQIDATSWADRLAGAKISAVRGTDDEIWPFGLINTFPAMFPMLQHLGFVPDAMHLYDSDGNYTIARVELSSSWTGAVGQLAGKAAAPTVSATFDLTANPITVTATIAGQSPAATVRAWWTNGLHCTKPMDSSYAHFIVWGKDDVDMRDVAWQSVTLSGANGTFTGTLPVGLSALPLNAQLYVDVLEENARYVSTIPQGVTGGTDVSCP